MHGSCRVCRNELDKHFFAFAEIAFSVILPFRQDPVNNGFRELGAEPEIYKSPRDGNIRKPRIGGKSFDYILRDLLRRFSENSCTEHRGIGRKITERGIFRYLDRKSVFFRLRQNSVVLRLFYRNPDVCCYLFFYLLKKIHFQPLIRSA